MAVLGERVAERGGLRRVFAFAKLLVVAMVAAVVVVMVIARSSSGDWHKLSCQLTCFGASSAG